MLSRSFSNFSERQKRLVWLSGAVLMSSLLVYMPGYTTYVTYQNALVKHDISQKKYDVLSETHQVKPGGAEHDTLIKRNEELDQQLVRLGIKAIPADELHKLLLFIARKHNVSVTRLEAESKSGAANAALMGFHKKNLSFVVSGDFAGVIAFNDALKQAPLPFVVEVWSVNASNHPALDVELQISYLTKG